MLKPPFGAVELGKGSLYGCKGQAHFKPEGAGRQGIAYIVGAGDA